MFVVGVGVKNEREINSIVSPPTDETKFLVDDVADLAFLPDVVFAQMCISESFQCTVYVYVRVILRPAVVCVYQWVVGLQQFVSVSGWPAAVCISESLACSSLCISESLACSSLYQ